MGILYSETGEMDKAVSEYNEVLEIDPHYSPALLNRGLARLKMGHYEDGSKDIHRIFAMEPASIESLISKVQMISPILADTLRRERDLMDRGEYTPGVGGSIKGFRLPDEMGVPKIKQNEYGDIVPVKDSASPQERGGYIFIGNYKYRIVSETAEYVVADIKGHQIKIKKANTQFKTSYNPT